MDISNCFPALADNTRRAIFEALVREPRSVGELAEDFPVSRPAVSQHLKVLQDAGLVKSERSGTRNVYEVDIEGMRALRSYLDGMWSQAVGNFKQVAEASYRKSRSAK
jgi:DNA-binding transcriptional ArsR family regulator